MPCARYDGVAVLPEHMGVNGVDLGDLNIKGLGSLLDDKVDAAAVFRIRRVWNIP